MKRFQAIHAPVLWIGLFVAVATAPLWVPMLADPSDPAPRAVRVDWAANRTSG